MHSSLVPSPIQFFRRLQTTSSFLLFTFPYHCFTSLAFDVVEPSPTCDIAPGRVKSSRIQLFQGFKSKPDSVHGIDDVFIPESDRLEVGSGGKTSMINVKERLKRYSSLLHEYAAKGCLRGGRAVHGLIFRNRLDPDSHLRISLLNFYVKCGSSLCARRVFDEMPVRDVVSWTALISGFIAQKNGNDGLELFSEMIREGVQPNEFTFATALKACSLCLDLDCGEQVHANVCKVGLLSDLFIGSALVELYAKCGQMDLAEGVFNCMPLKNVVLWNSLLNGFAEIGELKEVMRLFCCMNDHEMKFSKFTLSTLFKGCANSGKMREGQILHSLVIKLASEADDILGCSILDMYSRCGAVVDALKVFWIMEILDVITWTTMISCLDRHGYGHEVAQLFQVMRHTGVNPNQYSLCSLISAATEYGCLLYGKSIHGFVCKQGYESDNMVSNALITMYMKNGCREDGSKLFEMMKYRNTVSWNAMLFGHADCGAGDEGLDLFCKMMREDIKPNESTFVSLLRSSSNSTDADFGMQVHANIIKNGLSTDDTVGTALVDMYAKSRNLEEAELVFSRLLYRDSFSWNAIIGGYLHANEAENAVRHFILMQRDGLRPNEFTLASSLSGCADLATLEPGRLLHSLVIKFGHLDDAFVVSALIDMYWNCGSIEDVEAVFRGLKSRDTVLWNTMIFGYSNCNHGMKALETFQMMLDEGYMPDKATFVGALSACSQLGLIDAGKKLFNSIDEVYGLSITVEHCACMVDIFGRAGMFDEVDSFIEKMNLMPYAVIWENVLGSCKLHGNVNFGTQAAEMLFHLQPDKASNYVMLSNMFASSGCWDSFRKVRALMSSRGAKKEKACSWVEVEGMVHVFGSQDSSHPRIKEIDLKLEELILKLTTAGYMPKMENLFQNVNGQERQEYVYGHSERLALSYALICSHHKKRIRIFKNHHMCTDCHELMKLTSNILSQEIVVRDINHFHYFRNGNCSCQGCW